MFTLAPPDSLWFCWVLVFSASVWLCVPAQLRGEQPSYLKGDNFFKFSCGDCSDDGKESFERMRLTWQQVGNCLLHVGLQLQSSW